MRLILALTFSFLTAGLFHPALRMSRWPRALMLALLCAVILLCPFLLPERARPARMVASIVAVALTVKLYDLHVGRDGFPALVAGIPGIPPFAVLPGVAKT